MKKIKFATKICLFTFAALTFGLLLVWGIAGFQVSGTMRKTLLQKMDDSVTARLEIVMGYVDKAESYLSAYAQEPMIVELLHNQNNSALVEEMQQYTEAYGAVNSDLENVYLANYDSKVLTSFVKQPIGMTLRTGDSLKGLQNMVFATKGIYNVGILKSPSTGNQVVSLYFPVYDGEERLGFAGAAVCAESLRDTLGKLKGNDDSGCSYLLVDASANTYIFCEDDALIGTTIEDQNVLSIINSVLSSGSETFHYEEEDTLAVTKYIPDKNWVFIATTDKNVAFAAASRLSLILGVICITVLCIVSIIVFVSVTLISRNLTKVGTIISDIGTLDLRSKDKLQEYLDRGDEVGVIANATNNLVESISEVIIRLKEESSSLYETANAMLENSGVAMDSIREVEKSVQEIAEGATDQALETQNASASVIHIGGMIESSTSRSSELNDIAANIQKASGNVVETLKVLIEINDQSKTAIEEINRQTYSTNESALKIRDAAGLITSIAEETNLLSLNASIEAARAGEQGRGFSVVASQIQKLAEQSNQSARQIDQIINALIADSSQAVNTMDNVMHIMDEKSRHLISTREQFDEVSMNINETRNGIATINDTITEMDKERNNVVNVVQSLSAISEENAAATEETLASTELVESMMDEMNGIANKLFDISKDIDNSINDFII